MNALSFCFLLYNCIFSDNVHEAGQVRGRPKLPTYQNFRVGGGRKSNSMMNLCGKVPLSLISFYHLIFIFTQLLSLVIAYLFSLYFMQNIGGAFFFFFNILYSLFGAGYHFTLFILFSLTLFHFQMFLFLM